MIVFSDNMKEKGSRSSGKFNKLTKTSLGFDDVVTPNREGFVPLPPSTKAKVGRNVITTKVTKGFNHRFTCASSLEKDRYRQHYLLVCVSFLILDVSIINVIS